MAIQSAPVKGRPAPKRRAAPPSAPQVVHGRGFVANVAMLPFKVLHWLRRIDVPLHIQRQLLATVLILATMMSTLALVQRGDRGAVMAWWGNTLDGAFGNGAFLFPVMIGLLAARSFRTRAGSLILPRHYIGSIGLGAAVTGLMHLGGAAGEEIGGTIGLGLSTMPVRALGEVATALMLFVFGVVGLFLLSATDPITLVGDIRRIWPHRRPREKQQKEHRSRTDEHRRAAANDVVNRSMAVIGALGEDLDFPPPAGSTAKVKPMRNGTEHDPVLQPSRRGGRAADRGVEPLPASGSNRAKSQTELDLFPAPVINIPTASPRSGLVEPRPKAKPIGPNGPFDLPEMTRLAYYDSVMPDAAGLEEKARRIEATLTNFKVDARVREINPGPAVTQFTLEPGAGTKVKRITELQNDLALALAAPSIRIEAPIPGKARLGIEIPNEQIATVGLRESIESSAFNDSHAKLPLPLGRDVNGRYVVGDLAKMPHLLIAGSTGSGKSVCLSTLR